MKAVTWQGKRDVRVETMPDPTIQEDTDAIIEVTTTGLCGSDLHLYEVLGPFMTPGDILGHEPMGRVVAVGQGVTNLDIGDRVVVPFQIACGSCWMCSRDLQTQCEVTQNRDTGMGASLFGYSSLYGAVPGGQAELLRVPHADYGPIKIESDLDDEHFVYLSDVLPTAFQALEYSAVGEGDTLLVIGLGPIGDMAARLALHRGARVIGADLVPERLARTAARGAETYDVTQVDVAEVVREATGGRGADGVIDAVGMEAHGSPVAHAGQTAVGFLPDFLARKAMTTVAVDRLGALHLAIDAVRRGGIISLSGVYAGTVDPIPMQTLFDKQVQLHMGQANVRRWVNQVKPLAEDSSDPLGLADFATHRVPLDEAPTAYKNFQDKTDSTIKVLFKP
ncbi:alcohol dehydrogenase catalytic domain-containing protein [Aeromicrobium tamlense]|uniref:Alcohol dehydrogenase catalytic domain-containing protein n=1 Tax=Aeromicrobium tamlense TaxID=375541 RepID=A0A8I0KK44_9ACTN|nr:alcohol dehydrogenase catalytic domain-containing protein [Aeromicrobium tamlense]MBD1272062.1 alcohol dehydrogenase catalytic domain-containing protein [Aeromicrobium tamlense]NYI38745.1 threonine dehydrogenase-like Zn-dependent dehydrogenase [Aeromicrobium tamlense]